MHDAETMATDVSPARGRHRLGSSELRRAVGRMSLGGAAVLLTIVVGVLAAVGSGLTSASGDAAGGPAEWPPAQVPADPTPARAGAIAVRPPVEVSPTTDAAAEPGPEQVVAERAPAAVARQPIPEVRQGQPCSAEGARGVTAAGKPSLCTGERGDGRPRWRHA